MRCTCQISIGGPVTFLGASTLSGLLVQSVGPLSGLALGGFSLIVGAPIVIISFAAGACLSQKCEANRDCVAVSGFVAVIGALLLSLYCAYLICGACASLPAFTYVDSLQFLGHLTWILLAIGFVGFVLSECC